jgi:hypothetical protein
VFVLSARCDVVEVFRLTWATRAGDDACGAGCVLADEFQADTAVGAGDEDRRHHQ